MNWRSRPLIQFTRNRRRASTEALGDGSDTGAVADLNLQHGTFLGTQMAVILSHAGTLRDCRVLYVEVESKQASGFILNALTAAGTRDLRRPVN